MGLLPEYWKFLRGSQVQHGAAGEPPLGFFRADPRQRHLGLSMAAFNRYFDRPASEPADTIILTRAIEEACEALRIPADE